MAAVEDFLNDCTTCAFEEDECPANQGECPLYMRK